MEMPLPKIKAVTTATSRPQVKPVVSSFSKMRIAKKPSAFKRWLKSHSNLYIYAKVPRAQTLVNSKGYKFNRMRLKIFLSDKSAEELQKEAIKHGSNYLFRRKPDLVLTDFKPKGGDKNEIELLNPEDFYLDCYYAAQYSDVFESAKRQIIR